MIKQKNFLFDGWALAFLFYLLNPIKSAKIKQILSALYEKHFRLSANVKFNKFDATIPVEKPVDNTALLRLIGGGGKRTAPKVEKSSNDGQPVDTEDDKNGANGGGEGSQSHSRQEHSQPMPKWFKMK